MFTNREGGVMGRRVDASRGRCILAYIRDVHRAAVPAGEAADPDVRAAALMAANLELDQPAFVLLEQIRYSRRNLDGSIARAMRSADLLIREQEVRLRNELANLEIALVSDEGRNKLNG